MDDSTVDGEETVTSFATGAGRGSVSLGARSPSMIDAAGPGAAARFDDRGPIAEGGMAVVHRVYDRTFQREIARKELKDFADPDLNEEAWRKFLEEAQIVGQLEHPNIAPVHDLGCDEHGRANALSMKLVRGRTLTDDLDALPVGPLRGEQLRPLLEVVLKVCDALAYAHDRGVIHRDLKPSNVMVGAFGQVYLMDWGIALVRSPSEAGNASGICLPEGYEVEPEGSVVGTPAYMSPEQACGRIAQVDERTDVYGLGALLYKALTGTPPHVGADFEQRMESAREGRLTPLDERAPQRGLPPGLCRIVEKALAADPDQRPASILALRAELQAFLDGGGWFRVQRFEPGEAILREGEAGDVAYVIEEGVCQVLQQVEGRDVEVASLYPGQVFGETAIFARQPRTATIVARTEVALLVVTGNAFQRELGRAPWLKPFVEALARRFVALDAERRGDKQAQ